MPKGVRWSIDELFANIDVDKFVADYENGISEYDILTKYGITPKVLSLFLKSLVSMRKIKKIHEFPIPQKKDMPIVDNPNGIHNQHTQIEHQLEKKDMPIVDNPTIQYKANSLKNVKQNVSSQIDKIDLEINDMLLGINYIKEKNEEIKNTPKETNLVAPDENIKREFIYLCREGVPSKYILNKFGIGISTYNKWKQEFNIGETKSYTSPQSRLNFLKNQILIYRIENTISRNNGVMFIDDLSKTLNSPKEVLLNTIEESDYIFTLRLSFHSYARQTYDSVKYFKEHAFEILVYLNVYAVLKKIFQILDLDEKLDIVNDELKEVIIDLFETRLNKYVLSRLLNNCKEIINYEYPTTSLSLFDEKIKNTMQSIALWEDVLSFHQSQTKPVHKETTNVLDEENYTKLSNAIMNFLEFRGKNGATGPLIYRGIKEIYPHYASLCKDVIIRLLDEDKIFIEQYKGRFPRYVMDKFYNSITKMQNVDYGRKIEDPLGYINEILKLDIGKLDNSNNLTTRIAGLFIVRDYRIKNLSATESYFNFLAVSEENKVYVKIDPYNNISTSYLLQLHEQLPSNNSSILINFNEIDTKTAEFLHTLNGSLSKENYIQIWNKDHIINLIKEKNYEPSIPGSLVRVMDGIYHGYYGIVEKTNFDLLSQTVNILGYDDKKVETYFGLLKQLDDDSVIVRETESFVELLKIVMSMCTETEFLEGLKLTVFLSPVVGRLWDYQGNIEEFKLTCVEPNKEARNININFYPKWNGFLFDDKDNYNDTPQNYCKNIIINCDCLRYLDQPYYKIQLCRHLVASLIDKWLMTKHDKKFFLGSLRKIKFFVNDVFVIYRFFLKVAQLGNINDCKLILYLLSAKLFDYCIDLDFFTILNSLKNTLKDKFYTASENINFQFDIRNKQYSYEFSYNHESLDRIVGITKKFPQFQEIFKNIPKNYIHGCMETFIEIINVFFIKDQLSYYEIEHFVIESLRDENVAIDDKLLIPVIQKVWSNNSNSDLIQCIKNVQELIATKNKEGYLS